MSRQGYRSGPPTGLALAGAGTVWVATFSWSSFTEAWAAALVPLLGLGLLVALTGDGLRRLRLHPVAVVAVQSSVGLAATSVVLVGTPLPLGAAWGDVELRFSQAVETSVGYAAPVPAGAPGIEPLLIVGGLACLLLVDAIACTLRRVPLAGLPLLAIYSVPISVLATGMTWWVFVLGAAGFLLMLHIDADEAITQWGRALPGRRDGDEALEPDGDGFGVRTGTARSTAGVIGAVATAAALAVPLALPTLQLEVFEGGPGRGGGGEINVENPMVDLRRDLKRGADVPLVRFATDDPDPRYLRISVLTNFTDSEWTAGDREVPVSQSPDGAMPSIEGLSPRVRRKVYDYSLSATDQFRSAWLPTQAPVSRVRAAGDWRYDLETMDFIAAGDDLDTAGLRYEMTAVVPQLDAENLATTRSGIGDVDGRFLELPSNLPDVVSAEAERVTAGAANDFERAVALQRWFRQDGGFRYDLRRSEDGSGVDDLEAFLSPGGRVGYCEQFAASMAVLARELDIPARVAVGFLSPRRVGADTWEYSAHDLHAWPELYFPGAGWTRFEPTPATRASDVPGYTEQRAAAPGPGAPESQAPSAQPQRPDLPRDGLERAGEAATAGGDDGSAGPAWGWIGSGLLASLGLIALLMLPGLVRRGRRERRLRGGPEQCWEEVRDTVLDLGLPWPVERSPRETRTVLRRHLGGDIEAQADLDVVVEALEQARYARDPRAIDVEAPTRRSLETLADSSERGRARRARLWPRTVVRRAHRPLAATRAQRGDGLVGGSTATERPAAEARTVLEEIG